MPDPIETIYVYAEQCTRKGQVYRGDDPESIGADLFVYGTGTRAELIAQALRSLAVPCSRAPHFRHRCDRSVLEYIDGPQVVCRTDAPSGLYWTPERRSDVCGREVYVDPSGKGHAWRLAEDIPSAIREEIEGEIESGVTVCGSFVGSNGQHYRWSYSPSARPASVRAFPVVDTMCKATETRCDWCDCEVEGHEQLTDASTLKGGYVGDVCQSCLLRHCLESIGACEDALALNWSPDCDCDACTSFRACL